MEVFTKDNIYLDVHIDQKEDLLREIAEKICLLGYASDQEKVHKGLLDREKEFETALGEGFAIPHTKSEYIKTPGIMIMKTTEPLSWSEEENADVFIVLFTPFESEGNTHLKMLASLSRRLMNQDFKRILHESMDKDEIYNAVYEAIN
ncbi:PTS sugar transporter subunit IIA [Proteiniclasticum ruminis]|uniref:PTS system, fructose-specific IIA component n=1 Tax=Proteiniclasticum ruminis TaxID=398199 RepID=A0A1I5C7J6_9CLOT|nr:fructose PTS transporter subunit IIA [Proteiniclasticum ruminis]SFN82917.1 PTS system, fructose-specific IIA component [Proteiniclasticum ruminis]